MKQAFWAEVTQWDAPLPSGDEWYPVNSKATWGFYVDADKRGKVFTVELANEILDFANAAYKEKFGKEVDFNYLKMDMFGNERKVGKYDKQKNILEIYMNDCLRYANVNGKVWRA